MKEKISHSMDNVLSFVAQTNKERTEDQNKKDEQERKRKETIKAIGDALLGLRHCFVKALPYLAEKKRNLDKQFNKEVEIDSVDWRVSFLHHTESCSESMIFTISVDYKRAHLYCCSDKIGPDGVSFSLEIAQAIYQTLPRFIDEVEKMFPTVAEEIEKRMKKS